MLVIAGVVEQTVPGVLHRLFEFRVECSLEAVAQVYWTSSVYLGDEWE